jgi:hypothetical protein
VDGVGGNESVAVTEVDGDDDEVVNVLHVLSDATFSETSIPSSTYANVPCCSVGNFGGDMVVEVELTFSPAYFDLKVGQKCQWRFMGPDIPAWSVSIGRCV